MTAASDDAVTLYWYVVLGPPQSPGAHVLFTEPEPSTGDLPEGCDAG